MYGPVADPDGVALDAAVRLKLRTAGKESFGMWQRKLDEFFAQSKKGADEPSTTYLKPAIGASNQSLEWNLAEMMKDETKTAVLNRLSTEVKGLSLHEFKKKLKEEAAELRATDADVEPVFRRLHAFKQALLLFMQQFKGLDIVLGAVVSEYDYVVHKLLYQSRTAVHATVRTTMEDMQQQMTAASTIAAEQRGALAAIQEEKEHLELRVAELEDQNNVLSHSLAELRQALQQIAHQMYRNNPWRNEASQLSPEARRWAPTAGLPGSKPLSNPLRRRETRASFDLRSPLSLQGSTPGSTSSSHPRALVSSAGSRGPGVPPLAPTSPNTPSRTAESPTTSTYEGDTPLPTSLIGSDAGGGGFQELEGDNGPYLDIVGRMQQETKEMRLSYDSIGIVLEEYRNGCIEKDRKIKELTNTCTYHRERYEAAQRDLVDLQKRINTNAADQAQYEDVLRQKLTADRELDRLQEHHDMVVKEIRAVCSTVGWMVQRLPHIQARGLPTEPVKESQGRRGSEESGLDVVDGGEEESLVNASSGADISGIPHVLSPPTVTQASSSVGTGTPTKRTDHRPWLSISNRSPAVSPVYPVSQVPKGARPSEFEAYGRMSHIPLYLQGEGMVRNRTLGRKELMPFLKELWREKLYADKRTGQHVPLANFFHTLLQKKFGNSHLLCLEWAYSVVEASERYRSMDGEIDVLLKVLQGDLPEDVITALAAVVEQLRKTFEMAYKERLAELPSKKMRKRYLPIKWVLNALDTHFPFKCRERMDALRTIVHGMADDTGEVLYTDLLAGMGDLLCVPTLELPVEPLTNIPTPSRFLEEVRRQLVAEYVEYGYQMKQTLLSRSAMGSASDRVSLSVACEVMRELDHRVGHDELYRRMLLLSHDLSNPPHRTPTDVDLKQPISIGVLMKRFMACCYAARTPLMDF